MSVSEWAARWKRNDDFPACENCKGTNTKEHHFMQVRERQKNGKVMSNNLVLRPKATRKNSPPSISTENTDLVPGQEDVGGGVAVHGLPCLHLVSREKETEREQGAFFAPFLKTSTSLHPSISLFHSGAPTPTRTSRRRSSTRRRSGRRSWRRPPGPQRSRRRGREEERDGVCASVFTSLNLHHFSLSLSTALSPPASPFHPPQTRPPAAPHSSPSSCWGQPPPRRAPGPQVSRLNPRERPK